MAYKLRETIFGVMMSQFWANLGQNSDQKGQNVPIPSIKEHCALKICNYAHHIGKLTSV